MSVGPWSICPDCGAVVADAEAHTAWHESLTPPPPAPEPEEAADV